MEDINKGKCQSKEPCQGHCYHYKIFIVNFTQVCETGRESTKVKILPPPNGCPRHAKKVREYLSKENLSLVLKSSSPYAQQRKNVCKAGAKFETEGLVIHCLLLSSKPLAGIPGSPAAIYHFLMHAAGDPSHAIMSCPVRRCEKRV